MGFDPTCCILGLGCPLCCFGCTIGWALFKQSPFTVEEANKVKPEVLMETFTIPPEHPGQPTKVVTVITTVYKKPIDKYYQNEDQDNEENESRELITSSSVLLPATGEKL